MRIPRKTKQIILTAAKAALLVFLVVFLVLLMTRESVKDVSMDKISVMYKSGSPMSVDELLIIKTKEDSQRAAVESAMRRHVRSQMKSFEGYGTAQIALLKAKIMDTEGPYVFLAISDDAEKWKKAFDDIIN